MMRSFVSIPLAIMAAQSAVVNGMFDDRASCRLIDRDDFGMLIEISEHILLQEIVVEAGKSGEHLLDHLEIGRGIHGPAQQAEVRCLGQMRQTEFLGMTVDILRHMLAEPRVCRLTVGAVDRQDRLATFSSRGPRVGDEALKPDLTAPGVGIVAARAAGTGEDASGVDPSDISQVFIGDCFFLSPLMATARINPRRIAGMVRRIGESPSGGDAYEVKLYGPDGRERIPPVEAPAPGERGGNGGDGDDHGGGRGESVVVHVAHITHIRHISGPRSGC